MPRPVAETFPARGTQSSAGSVGTITVKLLLPCYSAPVSFVVRCAQCREEVLEADLIGDEEELRPPRSPPGSPPENRAARDPRRVAPALRRHRAAAAGSVAAPRARPGSLDDTSMPTAFGLHPWTIRGTSAAGMDTIVPVHRVTPHGRAARGSSCSCRQSPAPQKAASRLARRA